MASAVDTRPPRWRSARELLMKVSSITPEELQHKPELLETGLQEILNTFPKLSLHVLPEVLLCKHKMSLAAAVQKLEDIGFGRYVKAVRAESVAALALAYEKNRRIVIKWCLQDFELVLEAWSVLESGARAWLSKQFLRFWQSCSGEAELRAGSAEKSYGATLSRFKTVWSYGGPPPTMFKLEPAHAVGLGWAYKEVEELLTNFVDVNGDCASLVEDLQRAGHLTAALVSAHEGLLSACIDVCPEFLVEQMLVGQIVFPFQNQTDSNSTQVQKGIKSKQVPVNMRSKLPPAQVQKDKTKKVDRRAPQASLVLRLVRAAAQVVSGWGDGGPPVLTEQQAQHLKRLLMDVVGACADKSIAMLQAQPHIVELALCLGKEQGLASTLQHVSSFYIGATTPSGFTDSSFNLAVSRLGPDVSRRAMVVSSTQAGEGQVRSDRQVDSFTSLLAYLLAHPRGLDIATLVQLHNCRNKVVDDALRHQLHQWTLRAIASAVHNAGSEELTSWTLKAWLERWVRPICTGPQACEVFTAMAEGLDSWLFVLDVAASLGESSFASRPPAEQALVECVYELARTRFVAAKEQIASQPLTPSESVSPRQAILKTLLRLHPQQFAQDFDAQTYLSVRKHGDGWGRSKEVGRGHFTPVSVKDRKLSHRHSGGGWQYALDSFQPIHHFKSSFVNAPEYAKLDKSKTKEQWGVVLQVVGFVTPELLSDLDTAQRLATILCSVWSNHDQWASLCTVFSGKLLRAAALWRARNRHDTQTPPPGEVLVTFSLKCPHEHFLPSGTSKKDWVASLLSTAGRQLPELDEKTVSGLLAAHGSASAEDLVELVHAAKVSDVCEETERLFFTQLLPTCRPPEPAKSAGPASPGPAEPRPLLQQVCLLLRSRFQARWTLRAEGRKAECVDCGGAEFWEELERAGPEEGKGEEEGFAVVTESEGAVETEAVVRAESENRQPHALQAEGAVYRRFGERGEQVVTAFLQSATPNDLEHLFREFGGRAVGSFLCGGPEDLLVRYWRPQQCRADEVPAIVELLVEHIPQLWGRCGQLVWGQEELEVNDANTQLMRRLLRRRVPELGLLPRRWWHCVDVASLAHHCVATLKDESPLQRLARAKVPMELGDIKVFFANSALSVETQALLLDTYAVEAGALAEFLPLYAGPILGYLERLFALLDEDGATRQRLVASGDGVDEAERLASGWNKVVNTLLTGLRVRTRDGPENNWLHSEEQLLLFAYCCDKTRTTTDATTTAPPETRDADGKPKYPKWLLSQSNSTVLGDLLEAKCVDPRHLSLVVNLVLSTARPQMVRDAALRAMVRLRSDERHALIDKLLASPHALPLGVLFALAVSDLSEDAAAVVVGKAQALAPDELDALLDLIRDANPASGDRVHTFPRRAAVQAALFERCLWRFVVGDPVGVVHEDRWSEASAKEPPRRARDPRFFHLFLACCMPALVPSLLLDLLDRHLLVVTPLVLTGFEPRPSKDGAKAAPALEVADWEALVSHMSYSSLSVRLPWLWQQTMACNADGRGLALLEVVVRHAVRGGASIAKTVLSELIEWAGGGRGPGELLRSVHGAADLVHTQLVAMSPHHSQSIPRDQGGVELLATEAQALWVSFLARTWALEEREQASGAEVVERRARELADALPVLLVKELRDHPEKRTSDTPSSGWWDAAAVQRALPRVTVQQLGVDLDAKMLLVQVAPLAALDPWAQDILQADPTFAARLSDADCQHCLCKLQPASTDKVWPLVRRVLAALLEAGCYDRALELAIDLLKATKEDKDVEAVKTAYLAVSARERRQIRLVDRLRPLWSQCGAALQGAVDEAAHKDRAQSVVCAWALGEGVLERMDLVDAQ